MAGKSVFDAIKVFFIFFAVLFTLNLMGLRFFTEALYTPEGVVLGFFFCVINIMFMRL